MQPPITTTRNPSGRPLPPRQLSLMACQADDVSLMSQAISMCSSPDSRNTVEDVLSQALMISVGRNSSHVLTYLLTHGADVHDVRATSVVHSKPSKQVLEIFSHVAGTSTRDALGIDHSCGTSSMMESWSSGAWSVARMCIKTNHPQATTRLHRIITPARPYSKSPRGIAPWRPSSYCDPRARH